MQIYRSLDLSLITYCLNHRGKSEEPGCDKLCIQDWSGQEGRAK